MKINFCLVKKTASYSFRIWFRHTHAYSGILRYIPVYWLIIRHIQELSRHIQAYSKPCVSLAYSEPSYIQGLYIFRTRGILKALLYLKPCQTFTMEHLAKVVNAYNHFCNISFSHSSLYEINMKFFNTCIIFTFKVIVRTKQPGGY